MSGVGSGVAENQKVGGASNPEMAARLAALPPEELQKALAQVERKNREADELRAEFEALIAAEKWEAPKPLKLASYEELMEWKSDYDQKELEKQKEEESKKSKQMAMAVGMDHPLYNPISDTARRLRLEENVSDMDFDEMVFLGHCDQTVNIRKNFVVVFRTLSTHHGLWLEVMLGSAERTTEQHLRHWFSLLQVAASVQSINGKAIGGDLSKFTKESHRQDFIKAVNSRMEVLGRMPSALTDDLIVNYTWFSGRVRKMLSDDVYEKVGN
tara:strand:- start:653 stop:1462 length:810 start_codon:yes stop_codon:yes gene_type:complete